MDRLHVATLNIRNLADRWFERLPLLLADMAALQPDLLGLQEVVYVMQQDRLIGAAGEGRYGAVRGWAGRPEYGNSLLVREPLTATDVDRLDLGSQPVGTSGARRAARRRDGPRGRHPPAPPRARRRRSATSRPPRLLEWLDGGAGRRRDDPDGRLQRGSGRTEPGPPPGGGVPLGVRRGQRRRTRRDLAIGATAPGDGHRRRARVSRLHLAPRRGPRRPPRGSSSTGRTRRTRRSTRATTSGSPPSSRSGRGVPARHAPPRPPRRLAPRAREHARRLRGSAGHPGLRRPRVRRAGVGRRRPGRLPRRDPRSGCTGARTGSTRSASAALEALGVPTLAEVLRDGRPSAVPRRRAQGAILGTVVVELLAGARGPGAVERGRVVVRSRPRSKRVGHLAPAWPRWLNSHTLGSADDRDRAPPRLPGSGRRWRALDASSVALAQAAGLEVAAYTVRRRSTFDRLARLGRRRGLRRGRRARRHSGGAILPGRQQRRDT